MIRKHYHHTGSHLAGLMLDNWNKYVDEFIQIVPIEYKKVLQEEQMRKLQRKIAEMQKRLLKYLHKNKRTMGNPRAFLTIHRQEAGYRPVHER